MAPLRTRKPQRSSQEDVSAPAPALSKTVTMKSPSPARTPKGNPNKEKATITQAQKQALIDNLRLEITERARKLRATYNIHTQSLRSRLEIRVNRIPQALRSAGIMDLLEKYSEQATLTKPAAPVANKAAVPATKTITVHNPESNESTSSARPRGVKRSSNEMASDKENAHVDHDLAMPKKRVKANMVATQGPSTANNRATRTASRKIVPSQVLSPKSNNSRTLPRSPFKPSGVMSPTKSYLVRPTSPLKPSILATTVVEKPVARAGRTASKQARGGPTAVTTTAAGRGKGIVAAVLTRAEGRGRASDGSSTSDSSAGTTIITKKKAGTAPATKTAKATAGKGPASRGTAAKTAKETASTATATGGRVLRARR
ncbi:hypothetical protein K432DRAFT_385812 [Lepidopterella palustris CBS 459.81]|uniref:Borealin N-terminal domain-containing protein n=1 Tax=Lepidopterella palustris CBS 459.81 TaxID=1314670 RepID=A0A8E2E229_9PEZI|nr:hypothetical protein K432DRAFT_385812 [Lepidopterella palustris CBS 459.81]